MTTPRTMPSYVDAPRLCEELSIGERTVDAWVRQGIIPAPIQRGHKRLWKWTEVERYLEDGGPNMPTSADAKADEVRNATKRLADEASENRRGLLRGRHPGVSRKPEVRGTVAGNPAKLPHVPRNG